MPELYVPSDDWVDFHRRETDGTLELNRDKPLDDKLPERRRVGDA